MKEKLHDDLRVYFDLRIISYWDVHLMYRCVGLKAEKPTRNIEIRRHTYGKSLVIIQSL